MRLWAVWVGLLGVAACAEVPTGHDLPPEDEAVGERAYNTVPDRSEPMPSVPPEPVVEVAPQPVPPYAGAPKISVSRYGALGEDDDEFGAALCPFRVEATHFPAVSADGSQFTYFIAETLSSSDGEDELGTLRISDFEGDVTQREIVVLNGDGFPSSGSIEDEDQRCRKVWRATRARAKEANEALAMTRWRTMESLPLSGEWEYAHEELMAEPAATRGVEMVVRRGEAVVRIPGVKVLARTPVDWDSSGGEGACADFIATVDTVYYERESGLALAEVAQQGGPCFCYSETLLHPLAMPAEAVARIDARAAAAE